MQKFLAATLAILVASSASVQSAAASNYKANEQVANLTLQPDGTTPTTLLEAKVDTNRKIESEIAPHSKAAYSQLSTEPVAVNHAGIKGLAADQNAPQTTPTSTQQPPTQQPPTQQPHSHHGHHVRNLIIFGVVLFTGLFLLAVAAGKS